MVNFPQGFPPSVEKQTEPVPLSLPILKVKSSYLNAVPLKGKSDMLEYLQKNVKKEVKKAWRAIR